MKGRLELEGTLKLVLRIQNYPLACRHTQINNNVQRMMIWSQLSNQRKANLDLPFYLQEQGQCLTLENFKKRLSLRWNN